MRKAAPQRSTECSPENRLLAGCSAHELERLGGALQPIALHSHMSVATAGERPNWVIFPCNALVSHIAEMEDGSAVEIGMVGCDGLAGLGALFGDVSTFSRSIVQISGAAKAMSAADFRRLVVEPRTELYERVNRYANALLGCIAYIAGCNMRHDTRQRLSRWFLMCEDRVHRTSLDLTHDFIASMIGVRRASVTEVMGELRLAGALEYAYGMVEIRDRAILEAEACPCYAVVRDLFERALA